MKTRVALLIVLAIAVFVWFQAGTPNPFRPMRLGPSVQSAVNTPYTTERDWALHEITADIDEMAGRARASGEPPALTGTVVPWHPDLLVSYASNQIGQSAGDGPDVTEPPDQNPVLLAM